MPWLEKQPCRLPIVWFISHWRMARQGVSCFLGTRDRWSARTLMISRVWSRSWRVWDVHLTHLKVSALLKMSSQSNVKQKVQEWHLSLPDKRLCTIGGFAEQIFERTKLKITHGLIWSCKGVGRNPEEDKQFDVRMMTLCVKWKDSFSIPHHQWECLLDQSPSMPPLCAQTLPPSPPFLPPSHLGSQNLCSHTSTMARLLQQAPHTFRKCAEHPPRRAEAPDDKIWFLKNDL